MTREEALTIWLPIIEMGVKDMPECQEALHMAIEALSQPERKPGKWIPEGDVDEDNNRNYRCSNCGHGDLQAVSQIVPYCWWCGAKMVEPQAERSDKE